MANDIKVVVSGEPIKNGTIVVSTTVTGEYSTIDTYSLNNPTIEQIQNKYETRFDDPRYYTGDTRN
jgi:hypothetical protein